MRAVIFLIALIVGGPVAAEDDAAPTDWAERVPSWAAPFEPFNIIGNLYYVGTEGLAVFLIAGVKGHVLIDGGLAGHEQLIINNIAALGFDIEDVEILLNTHAHFDHSGGLAALKKASGATLWASEGDVSALEGGFYLGSEERTEFAAPPVNVDRIIDEDGGALEDAVSSLMGGDVVRPFLKAELTPGHSRGCTSFRLFISEDDEILEALIFCSASVAANRLANPPQYEGIVDDYRLTFSKTKEWSPDVFLANHPEVFGMKGVRAVQRAGDRRAFVSRGEFKKYIAAMRFAFEDALREQRNVDDE